MTRAEVLARAQEIIGYSFRDEELLATALTHASISNSRVESNERLEFLGDAILGVVVCESLFERFPTFLEGELTSIKSVVVSRRVCSQISDRLGLSELLFVGKGVNGRMATPLSLKAAVLESLIGAIHIDGGLEAAKTFILRALDPEIETAVNKNGYENYKSMLQQHAQKYFSTTPQYVQLDEQGPDHDKCFEVCVHIEGRQFPSAWGSSKKESEQRAAKKALEVLHAERAACADRDEETEEVWADWGAPHDVDAADATD